MEPAEARPGDDDHFKVTAKLRPAFTSTIYSKDPEAWPGQYDLRLLRSSGFRDRRRLGGLQGTPKAQGPEFPGPGALEYYENEVAWTIKLRIPPGTEPGKKIFRCQAGYMVCDDKTCSFPGQWTLPEAVLTVVVPAAGAASAAPADHEPAAPAVKQAANPASAPRQGADPNGEDFRRIALNGTATAADPPKPAKKDSSRSSSRRRSLSRHRLNPRRQAG